jgi:transglutaminase-like putative cysteine protease
MNVDRALQLHTAALAVMGALFLGLGHASIVLPLALAVAAVASAALAGRIGWLRLNRLVANVVALAAVVWSLRNFLHIHSSDQLLAIADMLVYLQIVLLFQEKTGRVYWQLIVLSLLQVVVASALNQGPLFGILLAVYMALSLSALVLLCLHRQWRPVAASSTAHSRLAAGWQALLGRPQLAGPPRGEAPPQALFGLVARQVALLGFATLGIAGVFFCVTPRLGEHTWSNSRTSGQAYTGFVHDVRLKEFGRVHLSSQLVMRVSLSGMAGREPYAMFVEPYFHGMVLTDYVRDATGSRWTQSPTQPRLSGPVRRRWESFAPATTTSNQVRQDYQLQAGAPGLFVIVPMHRLPGETPQQVQFNVRSHRLQWRPANDQQLSLGEIRYAAGTSSLRQGRQLRGVPHVNPVATMEDEFLLKVERSGLLSFDEQQFPLLAALAAQIVSEAEVESASPLERAQALERHFLVPGRYRYSLNLDFTRDPKLDPIEDFAVNHRSGHCEYFASALVLMLRSQGIPARLVIGYRGGDFNSIGDYYQVRQRHAHAWVEALLPAGETPEWDLAGPPTRGGAWYRLDPTPPSLTTSAVAAEDGMLDRIGETFDYVELLWRDYVLSLNAAKQQESIYEPVSTQALGSLPAWTEARSLRRLVRRWAAQVGWDIDIGARRDAAASAFDWRTGIAVFGLVLVATMAVQALYLLVQVIASVRGGHARSAAATRWRRPPHFYRRFKSLLARLHLRQNTGQTARELATAAAKELHRQRPSSPAAELPAEIVAAYYRVRFGGATLDSREQAAIERALGELTPAVHAAGQGRQ